MEGEYKFYGYKLNYTTKKYYMQLSVNRREHYKIIRETYFSGFNRMFQKRRDIGICPLFKLFYSYNLLSGKVTKGGVVLVVDREKVKLWLKQNEQIEVMQNARSYLL